MEFVDVRRLAALDMHGAAGTRRRRLIVISALGAELAEVDALAELRSYSLRQFWVVVPFLFAVLALRQARRGGGASSPDNSP